jgi:fucose 4-O-acetylase-like acetyltransferase
LALPDVLRGGAIILVVCGHSFLPLASMIPNYQLGIKYALIWNFHMPFLFFVSGLFASRLLKRTFKDAVIRKVRQLIVPYLLFSALEITVNILLGGLTNTKLQPINYLTMLVQPVQEMWFIYVLFFLFMLYYAIHKLLDKHLGSSTKFSVELILVVLGFILFFIGKDVQIWVIPQIMNYFVFFTLGAASFNLLRNPSIKLWVNIVVLIPPLVVYVFLCKFNIFIADANLLLAFGLIRTLFGIVTFILLSLLLIRVSLLSKFLQYCGVASILIYLLQTYPMQGFRIIIFNVTHILNPLVYEIFGSLLGVAVPLIIYYFFNGTKAYSLIFGR